MSATWTSNLPEWQKRHERALNRAMVAACHVLINAVKRNYHAVGGGYIAGSQYQRTGQTMNSITHQVVTEDGVLVGRVGILSDVTDKDTGASIGMIALFWALGHHNTWLRRYVRVDHWTPALKDSATEIRETFVRVYTAQMQAA